jgi:type II secretory pathway component GspD/PulD (secretin)
MKRTTKRAMLGLGFAGLLLVAAAARAEPGAGPGRLEDRVDLTLKNAAPEEVFRSFAKMLGAEATVDPGIHGPLSVELHNVRVQTLLDTVCESLGCRWKLVSGTPAKLQILSIAGGKPEGPPSSAIKEAIDLRVTRADGQEVLRTFGEMLNADVVVDPAIKGSLSLDLEAVPVDQCLDTVCKTLGCEWSFTEGANGRKALLRIVPRRR